MPPRLIEEHGRADRALSGSAPLAARLGVAGGVAILLLGALYLIAVRGDALLLDLSSMAGRVWCF